ncbi:MAG: hypothetical protein RIS36_295 [Pseudomonadota bacterium]|jgi:hypothetical protein
MNTVTHNTSRREWMTAAVAALSSVTAPAITKHLSQRSFIQIKDALAAIEKDSRGMLTDSDGKFDKGVKHLLTSLNSIEGKKPNSLFVEGLSIAEQLGFRFELVTFGADAELNLRMDWKGKVISVNRDWLNSDTKDVSEMHRVLSVIGAAFVQLKAWTPDGPPSSGHTEIRRSAVSKPNDPRALDQAIADRIAPHFVSLLVAATMLKTKPTDDLHDWHRLSNEELDPQVSFIRQFVARYFRNVLPDLTVFWGLEIQQLLAEKIRLLIDRLDLGDRGVRGRHSF